MLRQRIELCLGLTGACLLGRAVSHSRMEWLAATLILAGSAALARWSGLRASGAADAVKAANYFQSVETDTLRYQAATQTLQQCETELQEQSRLIDSIRAEAQRAIAEADSESEFGAAIAMECEALRVIRGILRQERRIYSGSHPEYQVLNRVLNRKMNRQRCR